MLRDACRECGLLRHLFVFPSEPGQRLGAGAADLLLAPGLAGQLGKALPKVKAEIADTIVG